VTSGNGAEHDPPNGADKPFEKALKDAVEALEAATVSYLLMGGVSSAALGRPRNTHDIDIFVAPEGSFPALQALASAGFRTEETNPRWLYKAWKYGVMVDIIFRSSGDIYLDEEMVNRSTRRSFGGCEARVISPEDLLVIKAITAAEHVPHQWYDALALLSNSDLDWDYLVARARRHGVRRILSLLIYAESNDVWIPTGPVVELFESIYGTAPDGAVNPTHPARTR
jgi:predicted nucleotidyltransferase